MVQIPGAPQFQDAPTNLPDPFQVLQGSSVKSISFSVKDQYGQNQSVPLGTEYHGRLVENLVSSQVRDFDTNDLQFWDNGQPKFQVIATVQTDYRLDDEDDGKRRFFFSSGMLQALQQEMRDKKLQRFGVGTDISVTLVNLQPTKGYPKKIYNVVLSNIQPWVSEEQQAVEQAVSQAPVQQVAPVQGAQQQWAQAPAPATAQVPQQQAQPQGQFYQQPPVAATYQQPAQQPVAPVQQVATVAPSQITEDNLFNLNILVENNIPLQSAVAAVVVKAGQQGQVISEEALTAAYQAQVS